MKPQRDTCFVVASLIANCRCIKHLLALYQCAAAGLFYMLLAS